MGLKEGKYKIDKLVEAIAGTTGNIFEYYSNRFPDKSKEFMLNKAHQEFTFYLRMLNDVNTAPAHGGKEIFGQLGKRNSGKAKTLFETKKVEDVPMIRVKGEANRDIHYLFGTARAVLEVCGEKKTMANMRSAIEELFAIRGIKFIGDKTLAGQGGQDIYSKAREDSRRLVSKLPTAV
jgi:hypothetical protein